MHRLLGYEAGLVIVGGAGHGGGSLSPRNGQALAAALTGMM
jgi:hypothetical protein